MNQDFTKQPFILFTAFLIAGILIGKFFLPFYISLSIAMVFAILSIVFHFLKIQSFTTYFLLLSLLFVASARSNQVSSILPKNHLVFEDLSNVSAVTGIITQRNLKKEGKNKYIISTSGAVVNGVNQTVVGKVLMTTNKISHAFEYGDEIIVKGEFRQPINQRNPGQFDYRSFLAKKHIYVSCYIRSVDSIKVINKYKGHFFIQYVIEPIKSHCISAMNLFLSDTNSGIMKALLLGEKQDIEKEMLEQFKNVGVIHVLAISGLHVGFIMLFIFYALSFFHLSEKYKSIILIIVLAVYVVLINFKAPVVRASLMATLFLIGRLKERKVSIFNIVFAAGFIILLFEPRELFNAGFQFSFCAVLSIIYGYKKLDQMIPLNQQIKDRFADKPYLRKCIIYIWGSFLVSLAAVLGTMPLTIYYYGIIPVFALFANVIVIPLIGVIVLLGLFFIILSVFSSFLAGGLGNIINLLFLALNRIVSYFNDLTYSHVDVSIPPVWLVLVMLGVVFLIFNISIRQARILLMGIIISVYLVFGLKDSSSENIEITFLDVGQGDASYVRFPNGEAMLVDGGDASFGWDYGKNTVVPFLKYRGCSRLKYVVVSHPHNDHIGGLLEVLNTIKVDTVIMSSYKFNSKIYQRIIDLCHNNKIPIRHVSRGDYLYPDSTCRSYILHPSDNYTNEESYDGAECNNSSIVLKIQYGENGILLTGDLEKEGEEALFSYAGFLENEILKVGHHGSKTSTSADLLHFVQPLVGIVSVAEKNKFRHPNPGTIKRLHDYFVKDYLTSKKGAVAFKVGKKELKYINWRNSSF